MFINLVKFLKNRLYISFSKGRMFNFFFFFVSDIFNLLYSFGRYLFILLIIYKNCRFKFVKLF